MLSIRSQQQGEGEVSQLIQIEANRRNAQMSTGPKSKSGKAIASRNATRHGLLSQRLIVDSEEAEEFEMLQFELQRDLKPSGTIEFALVERIAIALWRQRRLVQAESAEIALDVRPNAIAKALGRLNEPGIGYDATVELLAEFDAEHLNWCEGVIAEVEVLEEISPAEVERLAPLIFEQLKSDAESDEEDIPTHLEQFPGGLTGYVFKLAQWCQEQVRLAEKRPETLRLAEHLRRKNLILSGRQLDVIPRYQTTLDNQLYKALRALREAQTYRRECLELETTPVQGIAADGGEP